MLTVIAQSVKHHLGTLDAIDTTLVELPEPEQVKTITRKAGSQMSIQTGGNGLVIHANDLTLGTELETQDADVTVRALEEQGVTGKVRVQTPFRESSSFAAFYSTNADGTPFVHDVGTNTTHWLCEEDAKELELIQAKATIAKVLEAAADDPGAPFESNAIAALAIIREQAPADYQRARSKFKKSNSEISVQELDRLVKAAVVDHDAPGTHLGYSKGLLEALTVDGQAPVSYAGQLYVFDPMQGIWVPLSRGALVKRVAELYDGQYLCERHGDYRSIADLALSLAEDDTFFADAPVGLACPDGFISIQEGQVTMEPLTAAHRQRYRIEVTPTEMPTPLFDGFLHETFESPIEGEEEDQIRSLQEIVGSTMVGVMAKYQKAAKLVDPYGRSGKGVTLEIIGRLVPPNFVTAISPFKWGDEYYLAIMAGARLNKVGELPDGRAIPAAEFKSVLGGDLQTGRHPSGRPFSFRSEAAQIFTTNYLITTKDHSAAFFARWLLLEYPNSRLKSGKPIDPDLANRLIENELPGIAYWALQGAIRLLENGKFSPSRVHDRLMGQWQRSTNSLDEFIHETCDVGDDSYSYKRAEFYRDYVGWSRENGRKPFAKGKVYDLLRNSLTYSIREVEIKGIDTLRGIQEHLPEGDSEDSIDF